MITIALLLAYFLSNQLLNTTGIQRELLVYTPPVLEPLVLNVSKMFEQKYNVKVLVSSGPTGSLISKIEATRMGDVLITADHFFMEKAINKGLVDAESVRSISIVIPAIILNKNTSLEITSLKDLTYRNLTIGIADPEVAPFGRLAVAILVHNEIFDVLRDRIQIFPEVRDVVRQLRFGSIDVGILPHVVKYWYPVELDIIWIKPEELGNSVSCQLAGVVKFARDKEIALLFISELVEYVKGLDIDQYGYVTTPEDLDRISLYKYTDVIQWSAICRY
ncbi:MAG: substrate-binding domain-containing protein [Desulfurococcaceae archaeon]